ncbi:hypothetical protein DPMN_141826 [Dreissena polymorpha]|uniref:Uncharacterized protein n=1 Tax=Dreissena polymorpha TaxID=45954 RepID=A0A9D4GA67_DREPO|nr:hypothetical protein DPMN_141826 [Dreissena polymorpha]
MGVKKEGADKKISSVYGDTNVPYVSWGEMEPKDPKHHCVCADKRFGWAYNDVPCTFDDKCSVVCKLHN